MSVSKSGLNNDVPQSRVIAGPDPQSHRRDAGEDPGSKPGKTLPGMTQEKLPGMKKKQVPGVTEKGCPGWLAPLLYNPDFLVDERFGFQLAGAVDAHSFTVVVGDYQGLREPGSLDLGQRGLSFGVGAEKPGGIEMLVAGKNVVIYGTDALQLLD